MKVEPLVEQPSQLEKILAKLSPKTVSVVHQDVEHPSDPSQVARASEATTGPAEPVSSYSQDDNTTELLRLKQELMAANSKIALQEQELAQTRVIKHTLDQALGPPSEADFSGREITEQTISHLQSAFNASHPGFTQFQDAWNTQEDSQSDISDALSAGAYNRTRGHWNQNGNGPSSFHPSANDSPLEKPYGEPLQSPSSASQDSNRFWGGPTAYPTFATGGASGLQPQRVLSGPSAGAYGFYSRPLNEQSRYVQVTNPAIRRSNAQGARGGNFLPAQNSSWNGFPPGSPSDQAPKSPASPMTRSSSAFQAIGIYSIPPYPARPAATALSPTATEFTASTTNNSPWATSSVSNMPLAVLPSEC